MIDMVRVLESEIRDLERIMAANEALLEIEKSQSKRLILREEISKAQDKIERLTSRIEGLRAVD